MTDPLLKDYRKYPRMAHWFSPSLLLKLLNNVVLSSIFGQYADRRLMVAALDTQPPSVHFDRARALSHIVKPDEEGAVWIDWVADLGDGFDSTYAVASLLARSSLAIENETLPRGQALFMGGDEVYPKASLQTYSNQLRQPYKWAFPDHDPKSTLGVPLYAIPGNHDWYDGLVLFLSYFCGQKAIHFGSWRTQQTRSYFAVQLTERWWIWATDIQLADDLDEPQADYFRLIARQMPEGSRIILCGAEPGWLYTHTNSKSWSILNYVIRIAHDEGRNLKIPLLLSGDTHHYSRYEALDGTQFITSGGGGAFRHPTHHLVDHGTVKWVDEKKELSLGKMPLHKAERKPEPACYPSQSVSRTLLWRNLFFTIFNWDFSILLGLIYWIVGLGLTLRDQWDAYIIVALLFTWAIVRYTYEQEKSGRPAVLITSVLHSAAHVGAVIFFAQFFARWNQAHFVLSGEWYSVWKWFFILLIEMGMVGFFIGSTIFGLNLLITCGCFRMNYNDAFSAFRLNRYNNFLRLRLKDDSVELYSIGLDTVPQRHDWIANPKASQGNSEEPVFIPTAGLKPHIIEKILVRG